MLWVYRKNYVQACRLSWLKLYPTLSTLYAYGSPCISRVASSVVYSSPKLNQSPKPICGRAKLDVELAPGHN